MKSIFIFNPETDIVLGLDTDSYTPNKSITNFRKTLSLLPALHAEKGDAIMIMDNIEEGIIEKLPFFNLVKAKDIALLRYHELKKYFNSTEDHGHSFFKKREGNLKRNEWKVKPWGWNKEIYRKLLALHIPSITIPTPEYIKNLRILSHRRLTIDYFHSLNSLSSSSASPISTPLYLDNSKDVKSFIDSHNSFCMKAPWSSSGRGVIFSQNNRREKMIEWARGVLNTQGGVMAEEFYQKKIDFASEWMITEGKAKYCGLSLFQSDHRGKYSGNRLIPQDEIENILKAESEWSSEILSQQKVFIENAISPFYNGPLGFDMLVTDKGYVNPCVEINLRQTMGHVAIEVEKQMSATMNPKIIEILKIYFPNHVFSLNNLLN